MVEIFFRRLFRMSLWYKHCRKAGKHVCTYRNLCPWMDLKTARALSEAMRDPDLPTRNLPPRD